MQSELFPLPKLQEAEIDVLVETAVQILVILFLTEKVVVVACSFGKDSSAVLTLAILAMVRAKLTGRPIARLIVVHNDTEIENPAVRAFAQERIDALETWARSEDLDIQVEITYPALPDTFVVKVLSGAGLPRYPDSQHGTCSINWKVEPARRALRSIQKKPVPVVLLGSREDESARRARNMLAHNQRDNEITVERDEKGRIIGRHLSPISHWSVDNVWELLSLAGTDLGVYPVWQDAAGYRAIRDLYLDATAQTCVVVPGAHQRAKAACGARFGCSLCTAVAEDRSLDEMLIDPRYAYMKRLGDIRSYLMAIQYDLTKRYWVGRKVDYVTGYIKIVPDTFSDEVLELLTLSILSADRAEFLRATRFDQAIQSGETPDDPYIRACIAQNQTPDPTYLRRMRKPQFQLIDSEKLIALDFYWGVYGRMRPFHAIHLFKRVWEGGEDISVPNIPVAPRTEIPEDRWHRVSSEIWSHSGLDQSFWIAADERQTRIKSKSYVLKSEAGFTLRPAKFVEYEDDTAVNTVRRFSVDIESADFMLNEVWRDDLIHIHSQTSLDPTIAAQKYFNLGTVTSSGSGLVALQRAAVRSQAIHAAKLNRLSPEALVAGSIDDKSHRALSRAETEKLLARFKELGREDSEIRDLLDTSNQTLESTQGSLFTLAA